MTNQEVAGAGSSSEEPALRMCTKCGVNPRPSNSSWCRECRNKQAAEYRERTRPRKQTEERVCALEGCEETYVWESTHPKQLYCSKSHYMKARHRELNPRDPVEVLAAGEKRCGHCKQVKSELDFSPSVRQKSGAQCRDCAASYEKDWSNRNRDRRSASSRRSKAKQLLRLYGAPSDDIGTLITQQNGRCKCCGGEPGARGFHIDHDHARHEARLPSYRGLLCHGCNVGLGAFGDDVERLRRAVAYLELDRAVTVTG